MQRDRQYLNSLYLIDHKGAKAQTQLELATVFPGLGTAGMSVTNLAASAEAPESTEG